MSSSLSCYFFSNFNLIWLVAVNVLKPPDELWCIVNDLSLGLRLANFLIMLTGIDGVWNSAGDTLRDSTSGSAFCIPSMFMYVFKSGVRTGVTAALTLVEEI